MWGPCVGETVVVLLPALSLCPGVRDDSTLCRGKLGSRTVVDFDTETGGSDKRKNKKMKRAESQVAFHFGKGSGLYNC